MARKGYSVLGLLKGYGFHSDGLSPLTCGTVYNRMVSPSMLYGCEVWGAIPQAEMRTLEVVQKRVAKHIQGLHRRIHNEIVWGMLGWLPMSASTDLCKIKFVFKLLKLPPDNIVKKIFVTQLYIKSLVPGKMSNRSITSDICNALDKYNMTDMLNEYLSSGTLPSKMFVKQAASASVRSYETESWRRGLTNKGATRFLKVHTTLQPHMWCMKSSVTTWTIVGVWQILSNCWHSPRSARNVSAQNVVWHIYRHWQTLCNELWIIVRDQEWNVEYPVGHCFL